MKSRSSTASLPKLSCLAVLLVQTLAASNHTWGQAPDPVSAVPKPELPLQLSDEQRAELAEAARHSSQAMALSRQGKTDEASELAKQCIAIRTKILGADHPETAKGLDYLATIYLSSSEIAKAEALLLRALDIYQRSIGPESPQTGLAHNNLGGYYHEIGDLANAGEHYQRALRILKNSKGEEHPHTLSCLGNLGSLYKDQANYPEAEATFKEVLRLTEKVHGPDRAETAHSLNGLAVLYLETGNYAKALPLYERALAISQQVSGRTHATTITILINLGDIQLKLGAPAKAEPALAQALRAAQQSVGEDHLLTAACHRALGNLYRTLADPQQAELHYVRALAIHEKLRGPAAFETAISLNNLAGLYTEFNEIAKASKYYYRAHQILKAKLGPEHPEVANVANSAAFVSWKMRDFERAESLFQQAITAWDQNPGPNQPQAAVGRNNLASLYRDIGRYADALPLQTRALEIVDSTLGGDHPRALETRNGLANIHLAMGDQHRALPLMRQTLYAAVQNLDQAALVQGSRQQLAMTQERKHLLYDFLRLARTTRRHDDEAYEALVAWKGLVYNRQRLRLALLDEPGLQGDFAELQDVVSRLSALALRTPPPPQLAAWRQETARLSSSKNRLDRELSKKWATFQQARRIVTTSDVKANLPAETVLLDFIEYQSRIPANSEKKILEDWEWRLAVFVVAKDHVMKFIDLGRVEVLKAEIEAWRSGGFGTTAKGLAAASALRERIWKPLEPHLEGFTKVLISPDGELNKLPLAALPGRQPGTYLIEDHELSYVPVPSGLANPLEPAKAAAGGLLAVGDVSYDSSRLPQKPPSGAAGERRPDGGKALHFEPLAGTAPEVIAVGKAYRAANPQSLLLRLAGDQASEAAFREAAPQYRFLHLATHGFFAAPAIQAALAREVQKSESQQSGLVTDQKLVSYHPDLLSGIVLAGANNPAEDGDDGILTAAEAQTLDLRGVELVTLSACETGLGQTAEGEGLLGLQRAFQVAGAKNVVASLWKVDDSATQALMTEFYTKLWQKKLPAVEALRQAQLRMIVDYKPAEGKLRAGFEEKPIDEKVLADARATGDGLSPFYWAGFVISGNGR